MQGKRKKGGQVLGSPRDCIAYVVCDRGQRHKVYCGLPGKLLEVNEMLACGRPSGSLPPSHSTARLQPLWGGCGSDGLPVCGAHLGILSCSTRRARELSKSFKLDRRPERDGGDATPGDAMDHPATGDNESSSLHGDRYMKYEDWIAWLTELTKHRVLTWEEYSRLRQI